MSKFCSVLYDVIKKRLRRFPTKTVYSLKKKRENYGTYLHLKFVCGFALGFYVLITVSSQQNTPKIKNPAVRALHTKVLTIESFYSPSQQISKKFHVIYLQAFPSHSCRYYSYFTNDSIIFNLRPPHSFSLFSAVKSFPCVPQATGFYGQGIARLKSFRVM